MINIIIVEDQAVVRQSLKLLISTQINTNIIAEASNGQEFLDILPDCNPDLVLIDIYMPIMDGPEATRRAIALNPDLKVLALSSQGDVMNYYKMVDAGVKGFVIKGSNMDELALAIQAVSKGDNWFSPEILRAVAHNISKEETITSLSQEELQILHFIIDGHSDQDISELVLSSPESIGEKRKSILSKTKCTNTASLIMYALKNKILKV